MQFKIAVFMHQCFHGRCPQYIFDLVSFRTGTGRLRSATTRAAVSHRPRTNLGRRAFSIAGPSVWNSLTQSQTNRRPWTVSETVEDLLF